MSGINWDLVRVFLAVAREGKLRNAAQRLAVGHASVARGLDALETALGTRLFDRTRSGFALTAAGERLLPSAERMEDEAMAIARQIAGHDTKPAGVVRVSVPPMLAYRFLAPLFAAFADANPDIEIEVDITNALTDLSRLEADVLIRVAREVEEDVVGRRLIQYRKCIYASPTYLNTRPGLTVGDGSEAVWIGWGDSSDRPGWVRASTFPRAPIRHVMPEAVLQLEAAAAGAGLTFLPCFLGDPDPRVRRVPGVAPIDDRSIWLLLHHDLRRTARVRAFVDFMADAILGHRALLLGEQDDG